MKVTFVKVVFEDGSLSFVNNDGAITDLHYLLREGAVCINWIEVKTGERVGKTYPLCRILDVTTRI